MMRPTRPVAARPGEVRSKAGPVQAPRTARGSVVTALLLVLGAVSASAASAQGTGAGEGWRVGIQFGGISTVGLTFEAYRDNLAVDVTLGTFGFRDLGVAVEGKHYFGGRAARPFAGAGLWAVLASSDPRPGLGLIARVPLGVDWHVSEHHATGFVIGVNRALAVRRPDPTDDRALNRRLVPLPGVYYRWTP